MFILFFQVNVDHFVDYYVEDSDLITEAQAEAEAEAEREDLQVSQLIPNF